MAAKAKRSRPASYFQNKYAEWQQPPRWLYQEGEKRVVPNRPYAQYAEKKLVDTLEASYPTFETFDFDKDNWVAKKEWLCGFGLCQYPALDWPNYVATYKARAGFLCQDPRGSPFKKLFDNGSDPASSLAGYMVPFADLWLPADSNKDGQIEKSEMDNFFDALDADSDGFLTESEFNNAVGASVLELCYESAVMTGLDDANCDIDASVDVQRRRRCKKYQPGKGKWWMNKNSKEKMSRWMEHTVSKINVFKTQWRRKWDLLSKKSADENWGWENVAKP